MGSYDTDAMIQGTMCPDPECAWCQRIASWHREEESKTEPWTGDDYRIESEDLLNRMGA